MTPSIQTSNQTDSTPLLERNRGLAADSKIYKLAKSFFTKIGDFLSSCMSFCIERFNAFKEKVSPSHQQHERRFVRHLTLLDDEGTELTVFQPVNAESQKAVNADGLDYSEALDEDGTKSTVFQDAVNAEGLNYSGALVPFIDLEQRVFASLIKILSDKVHFGEIPKFPFSVNQQINQSLPNTSPQSQALVPFIDLKQRVFASLIKIPSDKVHFGEIPKFPFSVNQQINQSLPNTSPQSQALVLYVDPIKRLIAPLLGILRAQRPPFYDFPYQMVVGQSFLPAPQNTSFKNIRPPNYLNQAQISKG